jgi:transcription termination factor Rho
MPRKKKEDMVVEEEVAKEEKPKQTRKRRTKAEMEELQKAKSKAHSEFILIGATETAEQAAKVEEKPKRKRRTKAEIEADKAAEEQVKTEKEAQPAEEKKEAESSDEPKKHKDRNGKNRPKRNGGQYEPSVSKQELESQTVSDLRERAAKMGIDASGMRKAEIVERLYVALAIAEGFMEVSGILDILPDGYGFLRMDGYLPGEHDVYVGLSTIRRNGLRKGDKVTGQTRPARQGEKFAAIQTVKAVNDVPLDDFSTRPKFADLTPIYPDERLFMEHGKDAITARVIDLAAPIGKGQRGLIVSPPKAGKTTILKDIAAAIYANNPEVYLMCLLVDERPEEVTDMERSIHGEVISSTFDMPCENHIQVAELVIERAKRLVEQGTDVVILLDSITRLARAYNLGQPASGRVLSGGVDSTALYPPKRFLGAARNIENGGSLTILASALIDTGSKMDEVIFEEFKGTGNMELKLDRNLADRRIFPAIDPITSGTRKEELLLDSQEAPLIWAVRRILANVGNTERSMAMLIKSLRQTNTNAEFLIRSAKKAQSAANTENIEL